MHKLIRPTIGILSSAYRQTQRRLSANLRPAIGGRINLCTRRYYFLHRKCLLYSTAVIAVAKKQIHNCTQLGEALTPSKY